MVEDIKELRSDPKMSAFPMGKFKTFSDRKVAIEKLRTGELVPALRSKAIYSGTEVRGK
jgi:hypothetical protein